MPKGKRGWHGNPEGHRSAGKKGGQARKAQIAQDPSLSYAMLGRKGGEARKRQIQSDPKMSYQALGRMGGQARKSSR
jgi:general stress protein YciG